MNDPDQGLKLLKAGNERFISGKMEKSSFLTQANREAMLLGQSPFAIIVACSDSRVPPDLIFDQGIGRLFIVRVAGNVVSSVEQDSINYAVLTLKASLIVVLGHESCGAVTAVVENNVQDIPTIGSWIKKGILPGVSIEEAVKQNVRHGIQSIQRAPLLEKLLQEEKLKIVGGYYLLKEGRVEFFI